MTKNEGLLKKRILELNENGMWGIDDYSLSAKDVFEILDEMFEEFPTVEWAQQEYLKRTNQKHISSGLDMAGVDRVLNAERENWFKKWSGER